jgi:stage II sporulation protein D
VRVSNQLVKGVSIGQYATTRTVIETDGPVTYTREVAGDLQDVVIDVQGANLGRDAGGREVDDGTVRGVRWTQLSDDPAIVRVVVELETAQATDLFTLTDPDRIVVDVRQQQSSGPAPPIRIGLFWRQGEVAFGGTARFALVNRFTGAIIDIGVGGGEWAVRPHPEGYAVRDAKGRQVGIYRGPIRVRLEEPTAGRLVAKGRQYRGEFEVVKNAAGQLALVNELDLESYLYGVVPREMPAAWPAEALKAQAVAARTYARANPGRRESDGCDLYDTTADQVYGGAGAEQGSSTAAVDATRGTIAVYGGRPIATFFFSTAAGHTEHNENVFGGTPVPYLRGIRIPAGWEADSPHVDEWTVSFSRAELETRLGADPTTMVEGFVDVSFQGQGVSQRWLQATIRGANTTRIVSATAFRGAVGAEELRSTLFTISREGDVYTFRGRGYGHGVGLSQYGAKGAAEEGLPFRRILRAFYTDMARFRIEY